MASYNQFNYNNRPSKSVERKMFVDLMRQIYGVSGVKDCCYIGFGSIYFSDFRIVHKELGIKDMINIESEIDDEKRFSFNQPFSCIEQKWGMSYDVLPTLDWTGKKILWLDYEKSLQRYMFDDIDHVFSNIEIGSFYLLSCNSRLSRFYDRQSSIFKIEDFKNEFQGLHPFDLTSEMMENTRSPYLIRDMVVSRIRHNLNLLNAVRSERDKIQFLQLLFIIYKDGAPMVSIGGYLVEKKDLRGFKKSGVYKLPFIRKIDEDPLNIESPHLTNQEINLLNNYLPSSRKRFIRRKALEFIPDEEKEKYLQAYRYYPSFAEIRDL